MKTRAHWPGILVLIAASALLAASCSSDDDSDSESDSSTTSAETESSAAGEVDGLFAITAGDCAEGAVTTGSSFRMVQSGGTVEDGPFVDNLDSTCTDTTWTALSPGTDGGLTNGEYQPAPDPPFDEAQNGIADAIVEPVTFFAVGFAVSTEETDPTSQTATDPPAIVVDDSGSLSGELPGVLVSWNGQQFNQGSPKPDGSVSGGTTPVKGDYDPETGAYTLDWTSEISGGPFDGFTGVWHLEGTVETN